MQGQKNPGDQYLKNISSFFRISFRKLFIKHGSQGVKDETKLTANKKQL